MVVFSLKKNWQSFRGYIVLQIRSNTITSFRGDFCARRWKNFPTTVYFIYRGKTCPGNIINSTRKKDISEEKRIDSVKEMYHIHCKRLEQTKNKENKHRDVVKEPLLQSLRQKSLIA